MKHIITPPVKDHELQELVNDLVTLERELAFDFDRATESKNKRVSMTERRLEQLYEKIHNQWQELVNFARKHNGEEC